MLREIIQKYATCHVFWAADFKQYSDASEKCYSDIANITNYGAFRATCTEKFGCNPINK